MASKELTIDRLYTVATDAEIPDSRKFLGRLIFWAASALVVATFLVQGLYKAGVTSFGFDNWRPALYAILTWSVALGLSTVMTRGESGKKLLFVLPAFLFTIFMVIFPTLFGLYIAFTDWNLSSFEGQHFNGTDNLVKMWHDPYFWNAMLNMVYYVVAIIIEYAIAFGLAMLLNADIKARKFFRVAFLLPFMLSPVAVSWMIGKSLAEYRFGPLANFARSLGWSQPAFFTDPIVARASMMFMDAWTYIPFMLIMLLAGLQAMPKEVQEAARVDGATGWQAFWKITFPLMLPVSITAVVLRVIFKLKLADIVINVTSGGPGGATDTVTSFIFREYRDRSNVGYGTMLAFVYLVLIILFIVVLLRVANRYNPSNQD